jgi:hypothetical protein
MRARAVDRRIARARALADEAAMAARLARDLPGFLRRRISFDEARARIRDQLARREERFLDLAERTIYGNPSSPYLALLRHAGCEAGDLRALVAREGLEGALTILAAQGVYVTFDELQGRREAVRGSARFTFTHQAFDNPLFTPHWVQYTGGTRGEPRPVGRSLPLVEELTASTGSMLVAHGLVGARHVFWVTAPLPPMLGYLKLGQEVVRWFTTTRSIPLKAVAAARLVVLCGRLAGQRVPVPRFLDSDEVGGFVRWIDRRPRDGRPLVVSAMTSLAVRIAISAREAGIDLTGVTFRVQSEPLTDARYRHLRASGARVVDNYALTEAQDIGFSCAASETASDLHLFSQRYALVERERPVVEGGPSVDAMLITSLFDAAPKLCLNTETGDYTRVEKRACGCELGALGLTTHLSEIRSFEKLSAEGVSFVRTSLIHVLEEVLPARFGGTSVDYQLVEEEGTDSAIRLVLRVSPSVGRIDEGAISASFLAEIGSGGIMDRHQAELLRRAGSVVIERRPPLATGAGKVLPFHLLRRPAASDSSPR